MTLRRIDVCIRVLYMRVCAKQQKQNRFRNMCYVPRTEQKNVPEN